MVTQPPLPGQPASRDAKIIQFFHVKYLANNAKSKVYMQCNHLLQSIISALL